MTELRGRACPAWTSQEDRALRELWPVGGYEAVNQYLPKRTYAAIATRASTLRLRAPAHVRKRPQRYFTTEHIDRVIREGYLAATGDKKGIARLAERVGRPRWWVSRRALELGLRQPTKKEPPWTDAELELLESLSHHTLEVIRRKMAVKGFRRSTTAIAVKVKREGISLRESREISGIYSATGLARLLGVDAKTVTRWIQVEQLPAARAGTARTAVQGGDEWRIKAKDLRRWIGEHARLVDVRKVSRDWFIDLLLGKAA
jgi:DNA-binding transcriptional regulator YdaS (Cro superfamily)